MTLIAVCSLKGSPGVTTTALALAAAWPAGQPVVVECDPAGGDLIARYRLELTPSLVTLAAAGRHLERDAGLIWQHTQRLPGALPVVTGPPGPSQARAALAEMTENPQVPVLTRAAARPGTVVIADCGRIDAHSPALPVARTAEVMLLVTQVSDDALAHLAVMVRPAASWSPRPRLVLVGPGYPTSEVEQALGTRELGFAVAGRLPHDPGGAEQGFGGRPGARTAPKRSRLGQAAAELATHLAHELIPPHAQWRAASSAAAPRRAQVPADVPEFTAPTTRWTVQ